MMCGGTHLPIATVVCPLRMQAKELPEELQTPLLAGDSAAGGPDAERAAAEYQRRFLTHSPGASCLKVAGQSSVVAQALCGPSPFQVRGPAAAHGVHIIS